MLERFLGLSFIFGVIFYAAYPGWTQNEVPACKTEVLVSGSDLLYSMFPGKYDEFNQGEEMVIKAEVLRVDPVMPILRASDALSGNLDCNKLF